MTEHPQPRAWLPDAELLALALEDPRLTDDWRDLYADYRRQLKAGHPLSAEQRHWAQRSLKLGKTARYLELENTGAFEESLRPHARAPLAEIGGPPNPLILCNAWCTVRPMTATPQAPAAPPQTVYTPEEREAIQARFKQAVAEFRAESDPDALIPEDFLTTYELEALALADSKPPTH